MNMYDDENPIILNTLDFREWADVQSLPVICIGRISIELCIETINIRNQYFLESEKIEVGNYAPFGCLFKLGTQMCFSVPPREAKTHPLTEDLLFWIKQFESEKPTQRLIACCAYIQSKSSQQFLAQFKNELPCDENISDLFMIFCVISFICHSRSCKLFPCINLRDFSKSKYIDKTQFEELIESVSFDLKKSIFENLLDLSEHVQIHIDDVNLRLIMNFSERIRNSIIVQYRVIDKINKRNALIHLQVLETFNFKPLIYTLRV